MVKNKIIISLAIWILAFSWLFIPLYYVEDYNEPIDSIWELRNTNSGFIYFGSSDCPSCQGFKPLLEAYANENKIKILYMDDSSFKKADLSERDTEYIKELYSTYNIKEFPTLVEINNGKLIASMTTHIYSENNGELDATNQLDLFFEKASPRLLNQNLNFNLYDFIDGIIYTINIFLITIAIWRIDKEIKPMIDILAVIILVINLINLWNYGVYIDELNLGITDHIGSFGWLNILLFIIVIIINHLPRK